MKEVRRGGVNGLAGFQRKWLSCVLVTKMCYFCYQHSCTPIPTQQSRQKKVPLQRTRQKNSRVTIWGLVYEPMSFKSISVYNPVFPKVTF